MLLKLRDPSIRRLPTTVTLPILGMISVTGMSLYSELDLMRSGISSVLLSKVGLNRGLSGRTPLYSLTLLSNTGEIPDLIQSNSDYRIIQLTERIPNMGTVTIVRGP